MGFNDCYRFSVHAAIFNETRQVLLLKQTYGDGRWGLPGGSVEQGETVYEAIVRECREELGINVVVEAFTGLYYHRNFNAQVGIFRCRLPGAFGDRNGNGEGAGDGAGAEEGAGEGAEAGAGEGAEAGAGDGEGIQLSSEHSEHAWFSLSELDEVQRLRIQDALKYGGQIGSRIF